MIVMEKRRTSGPKLYSTGMIAELIGVSPRTVVKWIRDGQMKSFSLPSGERRIHRDNLRDFCQRYELDFALRELNLEEGITEPEPEGEPEPEDVAARRQPKLKLKLKRKRA